MKTSGALGATLTAEQVIDKYVEALGGRAAIEKVKSRVSIGTAEIVGLDVKGTIEVYEQVPNKLTRIVRIPRVFAWATGYNGTTAWAFNPESGKLEDQKGSTLKATKSETDFYHMLNLKTRYQKLTLKGVELIQYRDGTRETHVIEATPAKGSAERLYFDTQNGLLIRRDTMEESEEGKVPIREFLLDYKDVDGVKVPFTSRQGQGKVILIYRFTEIKHNVAIEDARFNKPELK
jgi:outer membrane lipoprotein-sorting protein